MLKKELRAHPFGFLLEGNRVTPTKRLLTILSEILTCSHSHSAKKVEEVYNFSQDDLLIEDFLILDTHAGVFVLAGQSTDPKEKQSAFEIG
ncbi:unnamed protein product [Thlaspi arvense]|uniref:Uncharacterized protein n=1 Tax=Thlaspi arvense TaxID=13288 RepID=A0AAU9RG24_THLAR|nr:unnamed protein product [Thlaspi arvense]